MTALQCNFLPIYAGLIALLIASYSNKGVIARSDISRGGDHIFATVEFDDEAEADLFEDDALCLTNYNIEITK